MYSYVPQYFLLPKPKETSMSKVFKATKLFVVQRQTKIYVKSIQNNTSIMIHKNTFNMLQVRNIVYYVIYLTLVFQNHTSTSVTHLAITIVFIDSLSEDGHYRPKHMGQVSYIYKLLPLLNFMVAPCINNIKHFIFQLMHTDYKILRLLK